MNILVEQLEAMAVSWPAPDFDVEEQRHAPAGRRLSVSGPIGSIAGLCCRYIPEGPDPPDEMR